MKTLRSVAFITTVEHNIGDDLVREGICYLINEVIGEFTPKLIHKHIPVTARPEFDWVYTSGLTRLLDHLPRGRGNALSKMIDLLPLVPNTDKVLSCDVLIQCGAPVYWCLPGGGGSHQNEWYKPLVRRRYNRIGGKVPFLNIGAGTCQPFFSDCSEFDANDRCTSYIRDLHASSTATTVRDKLSKTLLNRLGLDATILPCPSIFAREYHGIEPREPEYVALNFMPLAGHYDLGQRIDRGRWLRVFRKFVQEVAARFPIALVCHDRREERVAKREFPQIRCLVSRSSREVLDFYSRAKFYIGLRVHGAYAAASFGRPAFIVGSDTRASMMEEIGLRSSFVDDITLDHLLAVHEELMKSTGEYREQYTAIREETFSAYLDILKHTLPSVKSSIHPPKQTT